MAVTLSGERETLFAGDIELPVPSVRPAEFASRSERGIDSSARTDQPHSISDGLFSRDEDSEVSMRLPGIEMLNGGIRFEEVMGRVERLLLEQALRSCGGNKAKAAGLLGIKRTTLLYKMKALVDQGCAA
jgi:DNA-binding NtrC family response regulator